MRAMTEVAARAWYKSLPAQANRTAPANQRASELICVHLRYYFLRLRPASPRHLTAPHPMPLHERPQQPPAAVHRQIPAIHRNRRTGDPVGSIRRQQHRQTLDVVWLAEATRAAVLALDLTIFAKNPCNVLTSVIVPQGVDGNKLVKTKSSRGCLEPQGGNFLSQPARKLGHEDDNV